ncbi:MAG: NUDIX domain-containing protein [Ruminococcus sp.]|nr:NUDIX domain-containing protein [Candidatus Apopatosoma intestinale]
MKTVKIVGDNFSGQVRKTRTACRVIVVKDGAMLLSYETKTGVWMIPGGGLEDGESDAECCVREVSEETGFLIRPSACFLTIEELYEDRKWVNRYFCGEIVGEGTKRLTEAEKAVGMEPRWLPIPEIKEIFGGYRSYADTDEMRRGMYLREYTALCEWETICKREC